MNIAVYLGANPGTDPFWAEAARDLGEQIAAGGHTLVYGGSKTGLMGILAKAVLDRCGRVTGVEPAFFIREDFQLEGLTELIVTETMQERKAKMMELADLFIAFPGGSGTMEEITEAVTAVKLGLLPPDAAGRKKGPCIFLNLKGYYDPMREMYDRMVTAGFLCPEDRAGILFPETPEELEEILKK